MLDYENKYYNQGLFNIVGCDEAGRGPLAGPVVCAAVIMPKNFQNDEINDSKQLSDKKRRELYDIIIKNALDYSVVFIDAKTIDEINIYASSRLGMEKAISNLHHKVDIILTDAMPLLCHEVPFEAIIKGDAKSFNIACASILAKVTRDNYMMELDKKYPQYGFAHHKGYGTKEHLEALEKYGPLEGIHRFTYEPVKKLKNIQLKLF